MDDVIHKHHARNAGVVAVVLFWIVLGVLAALHNQSFLALSDLGASPRTGLPFSITLIAGALFLYTYFRWFVEREYTTSPLFRRLYSLVVVAQLIVAFVPISADNLLLYSVHALAAFAIGFAGLGSMYVFAVTNPTIHPAYGRQTLRLMLLGIVPLSYVLFEVFGNLVLPQLAGSLYINSWMLYLAWQRKLTR